MTRTPEETLIFLVANSRYEDLSDWQTHKQEVRETIRKRDDITLAMLTQHVHALLVELDAFCEFIGEPYSYHKHIKPLIVKGWIHCAENEGEMTRSTLRQWDAYLGCVCDYDSSISYIRFWIGKKHPERGD